MSKYSDKVQNFYESGEDFGKKPLDAPLTDEQKKVGAMAMAMNAAVVQLVLEGVLAPEEQLHFMLHFNDFAERIYGGEEIQMLGTVQTFAVNSEAGKLYAEATEEALKNGHKNYVKIKQRQQEYLERKSAAEQTNNLEGDPNVKPTLH